MKLTFATAIGLTLLATPASAHSGAGVPHVHLEHGANADPAHLAGLALLAVIAIAVAVGFRLAQTSSRSTNGPARPGDNERKTDVH